MKLLISQRETTDAYGAAADTLEAAYVLYFAELGHRVCPVSNFLPEPERMLADEPFDGLVLTGGGSLPPAYYHTPHTDRLQPHRDRTEKALIKLCREQGKPILAICRGMQYLNTLHGGRLSRLDSLPVPRPIRTDHPVEVQGERWLVNQYHNDGIRLDDLAPGLTPLAVDRENGVVEGFAAEGLLALQWHPERSFSDPGTRERTAALIQGFFRTGVVKG